MKFHALGRVEETVAFLKTIRGIRIRLAKGSKGNVVCSPFTPYRHARNIIPKSKCGTRCSPYHLARQEPMAISPSGSGDRMLQGLLVPRAERILYPSSCPVIASSARLAGSPGLQVALMQKHVCWNWKELATDEGRKNLAKRFPHKARQDTFERGGHG